MRLLVHLIIRTELHVADQPGLTAVPALEHEALKALVRLMLERPNRCDGCEATPKPHSERFMLK